MTYLAHKIRIARIKEESYVDGPGNRTVLWLQGCPVHCPGCQNTELWPTFGGQDVDTWRLAQTLAKIAGTRPLTITGGEPFYQGRRLYELLYNLWTIDRSEGIERHIVVYSGFTWEYLNDPANRYAADPGIWPLIDVLVDGPYRQDQDSQYMNWRGSANQRVIDVHATRAKGVLITLDWDQDVSILTVTEDGRIIAPAGVMDDLGLAGHEIDRCGQFNGGDNEKT